MKAWPIEGLLLKKKEQQKKQSKATMHTLLSTYATCGPLVKMSKKLASAQKQQHSFVCIMMKNFEFSFTYFSKDNLWHCLAVFGCYWGDGLGIVSR